MDYSTLPLPLHFRFTHSNETELIRLKHFVGGEFQPVRVITVLEEADEEVNRDHTHTVIFHKITAKDFRTRVKKNFPVHKGNCSFQVIDDIKDPYAMECYVCKGKAKGLLPNIITTNLTEEEIKERHFAYWKKNEELKTQPKKKKREKVLTWSQLTAQQFREVHKDKILKNCSVDKYFVFSFVVDKLGESVKALDAIIIRRLTLGVMNSLVEGDQREKFKKDLFSQAFPESYETNEKYGLL